MARTRDRSVEARSISTISTPSGTSSSRSPRRGKQQIHGVAASHHLLRGSQRGPLDAAAAQTSQHEGAQPSCGSVRFAHFVRAPGTHDRMAAAAPARTVPIRHSRSRRHAPLQSSRPMGTSIRHAFATPPPPVPSASFRLCSPLEGIARPAPLPGNLHPSALAEGPTRATQHPEIPAQCNRAGNAKRQRLIL